MLIANLETHGMVIWEIKLFAIQPPRNVSLLAHQMQVVVLTSIAIRMVVALHVPVMLIVRLTMVLHQLVPTTNVKMEFALIHSNVHKMPTTILVVRPTQDKTIVKKIKHVKLVHRMLIAVNSMVVEFQINQDATLELESVDLAKSMLIAHQAHQTVERMVVAILVTITTVVHLMEVKLKTNPTAMLSHELA